MATIAELMLKADYRQISQADTALDKLSDTGSKATGVLKTLAATLGIAFGVREVLQAADAYKTLTNRLALVTTSTEQLAAAQSEVFRIAQETRAPLQATAEVYQRLATNADQLGLTLTEVGQTTEQINKLMAISGTSAQSAEAALTQLGQAFASGTLRGEELNSVMEQAPALAKAIADGMGVTVGQLRQLGQDGKITASAVVEALKAQGDAIDAQFAKMVPTLSQATTQIGNSFVNLVGRIDAVSGSTTGLGGAMSELSKAIDSINLGPVVEVSNAWSVAIGKIATDIDRIMPRISGTDSITGVLYRAFVELPTNVRTAFKIIGAYFDEATADLEAKSTRFVARLKAMAMPSIEGGAAWDKAAADYEKATKRNESVREQAINGILKERDADLALAKAKREIYEAEQKYLTGDTSSLGTGGGKPKAAAGGKESPKKAQSEIDLIDLRASLTEQLQAEIDSQIKRRGWLEEIFAADLEAENLRYKQRKLLLDEYLADAGLAEQDAQIKREALEQDHQDRMAKIRLDTAAKDKTTLSNRLGTTKKFLEDIYSATGKNSERMTRLIQTVGAAQATANAYIAASQALADPSVPFFAKFAAVAQVIATGIGLANAIKGGGSASSAGAPSGRPDTSGIASSQSPAVRAQTVDIRIQGRGIWRDDDVAELMQAIGDKLGDGAKFGRVEFMRA